MNTNIELVANLLEALMFDCDRIPHHIPVTFKRTQKIYLFKIEAKA